jgi:hypothetical protein
MRRGRGWEITHDAGIVHAARSSSTSFRQADDEAGVAGLGFHIDGAAEFLGDDAVDDFEAEAGAGALRLGGEEGFEDVGKTFRGECRAVIADADHKHAGLGPGCDFDLRFLGEASTALSMRLVQTWLRAEPRVWMVEGEAAKRFST